MQRITFALDPNFRHKDFQLFEMGSTKKIRADHGKRLALLLSFLDRAGGPENVDLPGWRLHPFKGELAGFRSLTFSGNWRVIFRFVDGDVELLDYLGYY